MGRRTSRGRRGDRSSRKTGSGCRPLSSTGSSSPPWDWRARRSAEDSVAGGPPGVRGDSSRSCAGTASAGSSGPSSDLSSGDEPSIWSSATGRESRGHRRHATGRGRTTRPLTASIPWYLGLCQSQDEQSGASTCPAPVSRGSLLGVLPGEIGLEKRLGARSTPISRWARSLKVSRPPGPRAVRATRQSPPGRHQATRLGPRWRPDPGPRSRQLASG